MVKISLRSSALLAHWLGALSFSIVGTIRAAPFSADEEIQPSRRNLNVEALNDDFSDIDAIRNEWNIEYPQFLDTMQVSDGSRLEIVPSTSYSFGFVRDYPALSLTKTIDPGTDFVMEMSLAVYGMDEASVWSSAGLVVKREPGEFVHVNLGKQGTGTLRTTTVLYGNNENAYFGNQRGNNDNGNGYIHGRLRICRVGNEFRLLRNLPQFDTGWTTLPTSRNGEYSITRDDLSNSPVDVGIGLNSRGGGDPFRAVFDYVHFASPSNSGDCQVEDLDTLSQQEPPFNIETLSDEFDCSDATLDSCSVALLGWTEHYPDLHQDAVISNGSLVIRPGVPFLWNVWFDSFHGSMISKIVPGGHNFFVEIEVNMRLESDLAAVPNGRWNAGGIILRSQDDPSDWVALNIGLQGAYQGFGLPQTLGVEAKSTTDGSSIFNYRAAPDVPNTTGDTMTARLKICKVGSSFRFLHRFVGSTAWSQIHPLNPPALYSRKPDLVRTDLMGDLEVGTMTNSLMGTDLFVASFDYIRFGVLTSMEDECNIYSP